MLLGLPTVSGNINKTINPFFYVEKIGAIDIDFPDTLKLLRAWMDTFAQVSMCASVLMIVALTFERHFAIRSPHRVNTI